MDESILLGFELPKAVIDYAYAKPFNRYWISSIVSIRMDSETSYQNHLVPSNKCIIWVFIGIMSVVDGGDVRNQSTSVQTMQSVYQMKQEQAKILQSFNTPKYSLLVSYY